MNKEIQETRKSFLSKVAKGIAGITIVSMIPNILIAKSRKRFSGININVHPNAVKRNK